MSSSTGFRSSLTSTSSMKTTANTWRSRPSAWAGESGCVRKRGNECATASRDARTFPLHLDKDLGLRRAFRMALHRFFDREPGPLREFACVTLPFSAVHEGPYAQCYRDVFRRLWKSMCAEPLRDMAPMLRLSGYLREERHLELVEAVAHSHRVVVHGEPHVPRGTRRMPAADPRPPGWQQELVEPFSRTDVTVRARRATRFERAGASACIGLVVDEHQIRPDVTVTEVGPRTAERMDMVAGFQRGVAGEGLYDHRQSFIKVCAVTAAGLSFVVTLEPMGPLNRPHAGRRAGFERPRTAADYRLAPSFMAAMVAALGTSGANGNAFSRATRVSRRRTASEMVRPIAARTAAASSLISPSTRAWTSWPCGMVVCLLRLKLHDIVVRWRLPFKTGRRSVSGTPVCRVRGLQSRGRQRPLGRERSDA